MESVQFEEEQAGLGMPNRATAQQSGMAAFLVRKGLAKNEQTATLTLLIIIIVSILLGGFILWKTFFPGVMVENPNSPTQESPGPVNRLMHRST